MAVPLTISVRCVDVSAASGGAASMMQAVSNGVIQPRGPRVRVPLQVKTPIELSPAIL
ncbi:hypothetical protein [Ralstonia solanacearum]|uniref:hypothetical protein n=1 Tax=Ralstonia solanacearum TaxID=305 RepID=UPI001CC32466|nr:hypothetical protein [Ralstonia solanacearum]